MIDINKFTLQNIKLFIAPVSYNQLNEQYKNDFKDKDSEEGTIKNMDAWQTLSKSLLISIPNTDNDGYQLILFNEEGKPIPITENFIPKE